MRRRGGRTGRRSPGRQRATGTRPSAGTGSGGWRSRTQGEPWWRAPQAWQVGVAPGLKYRSRSRQVLTVNSGRGERLAAKDWQKFRNRVKEKLCRCTGNRSVFVFRTSVFRFFFSDRFFVIALSSADYSFRQLIKTINKNSGEESEAAKPTSA